MVFSSRSPSPREPAQNFWRHPALPFVESRRACRSRACYRPHHHPDFSIGAVDAGCSLFTGAESGPVHLSPGTLVLVPAHRVHACNPAPGTAWSYQMLHLDARWLAQVRHEHHGQGAGIPGAPEPIRILQDAALYARFCRLNGLLFSGADAGDKEAALIEFMGDLDSAPGGCIPESPIPARLAGQIRPVLDVLQALPEACVPLDALARIAGLSRYQLIRVFRAVTGMTPHAWQLNQRINLARARLRQGEGMAALAQHLGFADQAHFQRVFKAHAGVTPGGFRRRP
jgi:AraC-like DNA-binding protein